MTDLDNLKALLTDWGVPFVEGDEDDEHEVVVTQSNDLEEKEAAPKVDGYGGFFTAFIFDPRGAFIRMGAWE